MRIIKNRNYIENKKQGIDPREYEWGWLVQINMAVSLIFQYYTFLHIALIAEARWRHETSHNVLTSNIGLSPIRALW